MPIPIYKYQQDLTGVSPSNRVVNENHPVLGVPTSWDDSKLWEDKKILDDGVLIYDISQVVIPTYGVFYTESIIVKRAGTEEVLLKGRDYKLFQSYPSITKLSGKDACCYVVLDKNLVLSTAGVDLTYQAVGGEYSQNVELLVETIKRLEEEQRYVEWDKIIKPDAFPPIEHRHNAKDIYGMDGVVKALEDLREVLYDYVNKVITIDDVVDLRKTLVGLRTTLDGVVELATSNKAEIDDLINKVHSLTNVVSDHTIMLSQHREELDAHQAKLDSHTGTLSNHSTRIVALEGEVPPIKVRVTKLEDGQKQLNEITNDHARRITQTEKDVDAIVEVNNSQTSRIVTLEAYASDHSERISSTETLMADTRARLSEEEKVNDVQDNTLVNHGSRLTVLEQSVEDGGATTDGIARRVTANEGKIASLTNTTGSNTNRIAASEHKITALENTTAQHTTKILTNKEDIAAIKAVNETQTAGINANKAAHDALNERVGVNEADILQLKNVTDDTSSKLNELVTEVGKVKPNLSVDPDKNLPLIKNGWNKIRSVLPEEETGSVTDPSSDPHVYNLPIEANNADWVGVTTYGGTRKIIIKGSIFGVPSGELFIQQLNGWVRLDFYLQSGMWYVTQGG